MLISQERKFSRDQKLNGEYSQFMREYAELGHMSPSDYPESGTFLPHHGVWKTDPKPKLRVVFNASHVTSSGKSLNDCLAAGPKLQTDLWTVITRARCFKVFFTADIVKMFRQILVDPSDRIWQQIVWRSLPSNSVTAHLLSTVTYGTNCAPWLALETLLQLAEVMKAQYPLGAEATFQNKFVDDYLTGGDDLETALEVKRQLTELLLSGGFSLSKWASNCPELSEGPVEQLKLIQDSQTVSTLGLG